jgi:hypothetical protein
VFSAQFESKMSESQSLRRNKSVKCLRAVQLLASEGYPIELVLAGYKYGDHFHVRTVQTQQLTDYTERVKFCHWLLGNQQQLHMEILFSDETTSNRDGTTTAWNSHTHPRQHVFRAVFRLTFGAVLSEAKSSGRLHLKSA